MSIANVYVTEAKFDLLRLARLPAYVIPTILFPLMFYTFFALMFGGDRDAATYLLATYGAFGVVGASLFGFGISVAVERGQGYMLVKRASPMPLPAYFLAKVASSIAFSIIIVLLLFALGAIAGHVIFPLHTWFALGAALVFGAIPFCALGLAIGYLAGPNSAPAMVNIIYLPMSFVSGLWIPIAHLPPIAQTLAPWLPTYHLGQLALGTIGMGRGVWYEHVAALLAFAAIALGAAAVGYRRDEGTLHG